MHETESPAPANVVLTRGEAHFLAERLRRLFDHFGYALPDFASSDASLIGITGSAIGAVLAGGGRWHTYEGGKCVRCGSPAPLQPGLPCGVLEAQPQQGEKR